MSSTIPPRSYQPVSNSRWLIGSFCLHVILLLLIVLLLMPADESDTAVAPDSHRVTSAESMERLSEKIERLQTDQLWETVESLEATLAEMDQLKFEKTEQLREAFPEQTESAIKDVISDQKAAMEAQLRALEAIDAAMKVDPETDNKQRLSDARRAAMEEQLAAENTLADMAAAQVLADRPTELIEEVIDLQVTASQLLATAKANDRAAKTAEEEIGRLQNQLTRTRDSIQRRKNDVEKLESELEKRRKEINIAEEKVEAKKTKFVEETNAIAEKELAQRKAIEAFDKARDQSNKLRSAFHQVQQSGAKPQVVASRLAMKAANQQQNQRQKEQQSALQQVAQQKHKAAIANHAVKVAQHRVTTLQQQTSHLSQRLENARQQLATEKDRAKPHNATVEQNRAVIATAREQSQGKLTEAKAAQQLAFDANEALNLNADPADADPTDADRADESTSAQAAFIRARQLERKVSQRYKDIRAAELSLVQKMQPSEARKLISVAQPHRDDIDEAALDQNARTQSALKSKIEIMTQANRQAQAMDKFAQSLLAQTQSIQKHALQISLFDRQTDAAEEKRQSAQDQGGAVADMTSLMERRSGQKNRADDSQKNASTNSRDGDRYTEVDTPSLPAPPPLKNMTDARPARRFGSGGKVTATGASGWTFVDSWYILGPFDNGNRKNIHKQFPPESLIDLDAKYRTKASPNLISWQFHQSTQPMLPPKALLEEYVIYYAWTELHFEQATDAWIAVGSDDRSDLWINDVRVWSSSDILKAWRIDEGLRRVRFEAGLNKILYRIENGNGPWAFSLCINMDDQTPVAPR